MVQPTKSSFGYIRPIFILVAGWVMATAQTIRKHTNSIFGYDAFVMLPAYHLFYQVFIISALFYIYKYDIENEVEKGIIQSDEYIARVDEMFGFFSNENLVQIYLLVSGIVFVTSILSGVLAAYLIKNNVMGWRPTNLPEYRQTFSIYSAVNIGICLVTFFVITTSISIPKT